MVSLTVSHMKRNKYQLCNFGASTVVWAGVPVDTAVVMIWKDQQLIISTASFPSFIFFFTLNGAHRIKLGRLDCFMSIEGIVEDGDCIFWGVGGSLEMRWTRL